MPDSSVEVFSAQRAFLQSLAYRMLGSVSEAEDVVQECYLRWREVDQTVESPRAYLSTVVTRLCINHLRSARVRREQYVGPWLPEPIDTSSSSDPVELSESLTMGFLVLLESLSPTERAVFLLGEVFDYTMDEVAGIVEKTPTNCRQILHRARTAVAERRTRFRATQESAAELLTRFGEAVNSGNMDGLLKILHADAVLMTDGGGKVQALPQPIFGADKIARFFFGVAKKIGGWRVVTVPAELNREPALLAYRDGKLVSTMVFQIEEGAIRNLFIVSNPDKLSHMQGLPCPAQ